MKKITIHYENGSRPPFDIEVGACYPLSIKWKIQAKTGIPNFNQILLLNGNVIDDSYLGLRDGSVIHLRTPKLPPVDQEMNIHMKMPAPFEDFDVKVNGNQPIEEIRRLVLQKMREITPMVQTVTLTTSRETGIGLPSYKSVLDCKLSEPYELFVKIDEAATGEGLRQSAVDWILRAKVDDQEHEHPAASGPSAGEGVPPSAMDWIVSTKSAMDWILSTDQIEVRDPAAWGPSAGEGLPQSTVDWIMSAEVDDQEHPAAPGPRQRRMSYTLRMEDVVNQVDTIGKLRLRIYNSSSWNAAVIVIKDVESGSVMQDRVNIKDLPITTKLEVTVHSAI